MATRSAVPSVPRLLQQAETQERMGQWDEAAALFQEIFDHAVQDHDLPTAVDILRRLSRIRFFQRRSEEAEELAELQLSVAQQHELEKASVKALMMLAAIAHAREELGRARDLYRLTLDHARALRDDTLVGDLCQNLGIIFNTEGDLRTARAMYLESIGSAVRSGNRVTAVMAYNNLGMVSADLHEWMEAEIYFSRGLEIAERLGNAKLRALLYTNRAEPLIRIGNLAQASASLDRAEAIATDLESHVTLANVARWRGVIARKRSSYPEADRCFSRALLIAAKFGLKLERAEVLEELARLRWRQGRHEEALATAHEALHGYEELGAKHDASRVRSLLADWETAELVADWREAE